MADVELGLVEGYYGKPWSWAERRAVVEALIPHGYRFFLYAPKADAFLRRRWQEPHPQAAAAELQAFSAFCRAAGVPLIVGVAPLNVPSATAAVGSEVLVTVG